MAHVLTLQLKVLNAKKQRKNTLNKFMNFFYLPVVEENMLIWLESGSDLCQCCKSVGVNMG